MAVEREALTQRSRGGATKLRSLRARFPRLPCQLVWQALEKHFSLQVWNLQKISIVLVIPEMRHLCKS